MIIDNINYQSEGGEPFTVEGYIGARHMVAYDFDGEHTLHLEPIRQDSNGQMVWHYVLEHQGGVIFEGRNVRTFADDCHSPAVAAVEALGLLTLGPDDADPDYFDSYTSEQVEWRDNHCWELGVYAIEAWVKPPGCE